MGRVSSLQPTREMNGSVRQWGEPGWTAVLTDRSAQELCVPVCVKEATHNEEKNLKYLATCVRLPGSRCSKGGCMLGSKTGLRH